MNMANRSIKSLVLLLAAWTVASTAWAAPITENQARQIAANFMTARLMQPTATPTLASKAPRRIGAMGGQAAYYVFNGTGNGYVIVAGDDRVPAVLGYSDQGTFDSQDIPEAMQELLEGYAAQIAALDEGATVAAHPSPGGAIAPLLKCAWSQNNPYNILLPFVDGKHAAVGCVATAMAQVMHYWRWPERTMAAIPAYKTETLSISMPTLPVTTLDWQNMDNTYETTDTLSVRGKAAATLSLYCAQAVEMDFTKDGSSATITDIPAAMTNYFGYKAGARVYSRDNFTTQQWEKMAYDELAAGRPVIYRGSKSSGGHAFVCDGYDGNGMFHINWGWNGRSNGYFVLNVLNPDAQGTGSASGAYGYIYNQRLITGLEPGEEACGIEVLTKHLEVLSYIGTRNSSRGTFSASMLTQLLNITSQTISFDYGWALYQGSELVQIIGTDVKNNLQSNYYFGVTRNLTFGSNISSGTYRILPIYSEQNAGNWRPCVGSDVIYAEVVIDGNTCTVTSHGVGCTPDYQINEITTTGHMHVNRPVNINVNLTNNGNSRNDLIYMFAGNSFYSTAFIDLDKGETGDVHFEYSSGTAGTTQLTFSLNKDGTSPIASTAVTINDMPSASLNGSLTVANVTDRDNHVITSDKFKVQVNISNHSTAAYDEDIIIKLYKHIYGSTGTLVQTQTKPLTLDRRKTATLEFELDNVMDGWSYFALVYYYSEGKEVRLAGTATHTINFPDDTIHPRGDVDGNGEVNIADINIVIHIIMGGNIPDDMRLRADVDGNGEVNIADVNALIDILLKG